MATNNILTDAIITKESLRILHNNLGLTKGINREYSSQFARTGGKIGQSINVRKPNRYNVQQGPAITPQGTSESTVPLTLDRQWVVPMTFSSKELTLSIDEFSKRYIAPAVAKLASVIDLDCAVAAVTGKYADGTAVSGGAGPVAAIVGTPATTPGTSGGSATGLLQYNAPGVYLNAGRVLDFMAAPRDNARTCLIDPSANAMSVAALSGLFNPQGVVSDQYKNGLLGNALGFDFVMSQNLPTFTAGTRVATAGTNTVDSTAAAYGTAGTSSTSVSLKGVSSSTTIKAGDVFTIADIYSVNPETQQSTGLLFPFVATADATLSADPTSVTVAAFKVAGTGVADGNIIRSGSGSATSSVTWISGAASGVSPQNLAFHKDAFTLGTADLEVPQGVAFGASENHDGISMRIIRDYDIMSDFMVCRIDVLGGFACLRPEMAVRIAG